MTNYLSAYLSAYLSELEYAAFAIVLLGMYLIGKPSRWGFIVFIASQVLWLCAASIRDSDGLVLQSVTLIIVNIINYLRWKKKDIG